MQGDKELIDGIVSDYYNSISQHFDYRLKNKWKIDFWEIIHALATLFLIVNIIPLLAVWENYLVSLYNYFKPYLTTTPFKANTWPTRWILGVLLALVIIAITYPIQRYWQLQGKRLSLPYKFLLFCYIYSVRKELKSYLINDNPQHIDNSKKFFKFYINIFTYNSYNYGSEKSIKVKITKLTNDIREKHNWIQFSQETSEMIEALSSTEKITERLNQMVELEEVVRIVDYLVLYEFSKIKKDELAPDNTRLESKRTKYLLEFARGVNGLNNIDPIPEASATKENLFKTIIASIPALFHSSNIFILFLSWLILLIALFVPASLLAISHYSLRIDSTIVIGILTAPFVGAVTLAATIYSKNKKSE